MHWVRCPLCHAREFVRLAHARKDPLATHFGSPGGYQFVVCRGCGHAFQNPQLDQEELHALYPEKFIALRKGFTSEAPSPDYVERQIRAARRRLAFIDQKFSPASSPPAVLDVGCGGGFLLGLLRERGWRACGVEPNRGFGRYARETWAVEVEEGYFSEESFGGQMFDVVVCSHIVEHVPDPVGFLRQCGARVRPGGLLYVEVPSPDHSYPLIPLDNFFQKGHLHLFFEQNFMRTLSLAGLDVFALERVGPNLCALARPDRSARAASSGWLRSVWQVQSYRVRRFVRFGWKELVKQVIRRSRGERTLNGLVASP